MEQVKDQNKTLLPMNLQFFAEGGNDDGADGNEGSAEAVTFKNQSELDSWFDTKLDKSLTTAREKWEKEQEEKTKAAEEKGKRTAEEQAQFELQQKYDELDKEKVALQRDKDETNIIKRLASDKLPDSLAMALQPLYGGDEKILNDAYSSIVKSFREAVEGAVNERLKRSSDSFSLGGNPQNETLGEQMAKKANKQNQVESKFWK